MKTNQHTSPLTAIAASLVETNTDFHGPVPEEIVIIDECGDTLWDKVLAQANFPKEGKQNSASTNKHQ